MRIGESVSADIVFIQPHPIMPTVAPMSSGVFQVQCFIRCSQEARPDGLLLRKCILTLDLLKSSVTVKYNVGETAAHSWVTILTKFQLLQINIWRIIVISNYILQVNNNLSFVSDGL